MHLLSYIITAICSDATPVVYNIDTSESYNQICCSYFKDIHTIRDIEAFSISKDLKAITIFSSSSASDNLLNKTICPKCLFKAYEFVLFSKNTFDKKILCSNIDLDVKDCKGEEIKSIFTLEDGHIAVISILDHNFLPILTANGIILAECIIHKDNNTISIVPKGKINKFFDPSRSFNTKFYNLQESIVEIKN
jgi:hypothetical protein